MQTKTQQYAEAIRREYEPKTEQVTKLEELKALDAKVHRPAAVFAYTFGVIGALVLGVGLCLAMKVIGDLMALGIVMAVCAHLVKGLRAFFAPIISVVRTVPTMAVILMLLLWTTPNMVPVIVSALVLFPAVYAAALAALDEVGENYGELTRAFRVPLLRRIGKMYLPLAAPVMLKQAGGIFSLGLKVVISGEVLASTYRSLGGMMQDAQMYLNMPRLMALTLLVLLMGFALEGLCWLSYRLIVRWRT